MDFKILITGRMETIVNDVKNHLERDRGYDVMTCIPNKRELFGAFLSALPQVIILCLRNEPGQTVSVYDLLREYDVADAAVIIVISSHADRTIFTAHTGLREFTFLPRPLSLSALYYKLHEIEEKWEANGRSFVTDKIETVVRDDLIERPRKHIMVVDDSPEQLTQIKEQLREFYDVTLVSAGKNAPRYLGRYKVDLILLDYIMPDMDGIQVFRLLQSNPHFHTIPVVFMTGASERDAAAKIIRGIAPYGCVVKPTKKSELVARIIEVLG